MPIYWSTVGFKYTDRSRFRHLDDSSNLLDFPFFICFIHKPDFFNFGKQMRDWTSKDLSHSQILMQIDIIAPRNKLFPMSVYVILVPPPINNSVIHTFSADTAVCGQPLTWSSTRLVSPVLNSPNYLKPVARMEWNPFMHITMFVNLFNRLNQFQNRIIIQHPNIGG